MPLWLWVIEVLAVTIALTLALIITLAVRRRVIARGGPTFDISVNPRNDDDGSGWTMGVGRYRGDEFEFFRVFSLAMRPRYRFKRGTVDVGQRRPPSGKEIQATHQSFVIVGVEAKQAPVQQMAMTPGALTALLAWLESSPPGHNVNNVV